MLNSKKWSRPDPFRAHLPFLHAADPRTRRPYPPGRAGVALGGGVAPFAVARMSRRSRAHHRSPRSRSLAAGRDVARVLVVSPRARPGARRSARGGGCAPRRAHRRNPVRCVAVPLARFRRRCQRRMRSPATGESPSTILARPEIGVPGCAAGRAAPACSPLAANDATAAMAIQRKK